MLNQPYPNLIEPELYQQYMAALLAGERLLCTKIVKNIMVMGVSLNDIYTHLFQHSLYQVGELWAHQQISVATEHMATAITGRMLALVQENVFGGPARDTSIIIACVAGEFHQIGAQMVADLCEISGWRGYFLGANTPLSDLLHLINELKPNLLGLSLSLSIHLPALIDALDGIGSKCPDLPVIVGGQAFCHGNLEVIEKYANVSYLATLEQLAEWLRFYEP